MRRARRVRAWIADGNAAGEPAFHGRRDPLRQQRRGAGLALRIERRIPGKLVLGIAGRCHRVPDFDARRHVGANCLMDGILFACVLRKPSKRLGLGENRIHRLHDSRRRAKRKVEPAVMEGLSDVTQALLELEPHAMEPCGICALEGEDRLLFVAHCEDRADTILPRAMAHEEFLGKLLDDFPLLRARILRLVDQNVIDAAVELVLHPGRRLVRQEVNDLADEVVIVERAARALHLFVALDHGAGDDIQRVRALEGNGGPPLFQKFRQARALIE